MKKLMPIFLLILSPLVTAQEKEIWACQEIDTNGFKWSNDQWDRQGFKAGNMLVTIDGSFSILKVGNRERVMTCTGSGTWFCVDSLETDFFRLNATTGEAARSVLFGAVYNHDSYSGRDDVALSLYQCTKF
ncbi:MAG: hypothetical protein WDZ52_15345 [Pseudohongiellaceae bacterium]